MIGFLDDTHPPWEHPELQCPTCEGREWVEDEDDMMPCPDCNGGTTIPTEAEIIAHLEREAGAEIDRAALIAKQHDYEAAVLGARVAACGHMLAINTVDSLIRGMCEEAMGGPLEPPPPPPRFAGEAEAMAWAWS